MKLDFFFIEKVVLKKKKYRWLTYIYKVYKNSQHIN